MNTSFEYSNLRLHTRHVHKCTSTQNTQVHEYTCARALPLLPAATQDSADQIRQIGWDSKFLASALGGYKRISAPIHFILYIMTGGSYHKVIISTITVFFSHRNPTNHILRKMFYFHESFPSSHPWHILCDQNQMILEIDRIPQNERKFMLRSITPINSKYSHQMERIMSINIFSSQVQPNLKFLPITGNFSHT